MRRAFRRILILSDINMMINGCKTLISGVFDAAPGNPCGAATDWWRMQSPSNRSLHLISLLTGKITAKSGLDAFPGALGP
jgi:hypothetical protein